ncbi:unnamed protein product [Heterobilharzia americana]|nr:unnamed protein product [Heterobilharzia americana]
MTEPSSCTHYFKGEPLKQLTLTSSSLPPLQPSQTHKVFFRCDRKIEKPPTPYPDSYYDKWNGSYVRMPCSPENVYPTYEGGVNSLSSRWIMIEKALRQKIGSSHELKEAILSYNSRFKSYWNFKTLEHLSLNLPVFITKPIPLLKRGYECSLTLSQLQIASLLAMHSFVHFPDVIPKVKKRNMLISLKSISLTYCRRGL